MWCGQLRRPHHTQKEDIGGTKPLQTTLFRQLLRVCLKVGIPPKRQGAKGHDGSKLTIIPIFGSSRLGGLVAFTRFRQHAMVGKPVSEVPRKDCMSVFGECIV